MAGENHNSYYDGICPNGMTYDVKSFGFDGSQWGFSINNKYKEEIEIYYLLTFNEDYTELIHAWRVNISDLWDVIDKGQIHVYIRKPSRKYIHYAVDDMKKCSVTDQIVDVLVKNGYFEKIKNYRNARDKGMTIYEYDKQLYDGCIIL